MSSQPHHLQKSYDLLTCTVKQPQFSYAHLSLITTSDQNNNNNGSTSLDNLQVKSYCTAALQQFLGISGAAIPLDVLKVCGSECWVRVPRPDLGAFAAAITSWRGTSDGGVGCCLRLEQCSDWLGAIVGGDGQHFVWNS